MTVGGIYLSAVTLFVLGLYWFAAQLSYSRRASSSPIGALPAAHTSGYAVVVWPMRHAFWAEGAKGAVLGDEDGRRYQGGTSDEEGEAVKHRIESFRGCGASCIDARTLAHLTYGCQPHILSL